MGVGGFDSDEVGSDPTVHIPRPVPPSGGSASVEPPEAAGRRRGGWKVVAIGLPVLALSVAAGAGAARLLAKNDPQPPRDTTSTMEPVTTTTSPGLRPVSEVTVLVLNGGGPDGAASNYASQLRTDGYPTRRPGGAAEPIGATTVFFGPGFEAEAVQIAMRLDLPSDVVRPLPSETLGADLLSADVVVVLGPDLESPPSSTTMPTTPSSTTAPRTTTTIPPTTAPPPPPPPDTTGTTVPRTTQPGCFDIVCNVEGRPLRRRRKLLRARARWDPWTGKLTSLDDTLAWYWARLGELEHASIRAFELLAAQAHRAGAPAELVQRIHQAADQEADHTDRCFALASRFAGRRVRAGRLPRLRRLERRVDLVQIAVDSLLDGVMNEGFAAGLARLQLDLATDPQVVETLAVIAADEQDHADLSLVILEWCLQAGGQSVLEAVALASQQLPTYRGPDLPAGVDSAVLARFGFSCPPGVEDLMHQVAGETKAWLDLLLDPTPALASTS